MRASDLKKHSISVSMEFRCLATHSSSANDQPGFSFMTMWMLIRATLRVAGNSENIAMGLWDFAIPYLSNAYDDDEYQLPTS